MADSAPVRKLLNMVLLLAIKDHASDLHFEPFEDEFRIRIKADGVLYEMVPPPRHLAFAITTRIKIMANLDIAERRLPQDGRIRLRVQGKEIDLRVSTVPTMHGESVVMRILDKGGVALDFAKLGFLDDTLERIREGDPLWLFVCVLFEIASFGGYIWLFRAVFVHGSTRIDWRASYEITMAGLAATRLFAAAGAGSGYQVGLGFSADGDDQSRGRFSIIDAAGNVRESMVEAVAVADENAAAAGQMTDGIAEVQKSIESVATVSDENAAAAQEVSASAEQVGASIQEMASASHSLDEMAGRLQKLAAQFKV